MEFKLKSPPREFTVKSITLSHMADISLSEDELVTFQSPSGKELDVTAKDWGYYLSGSTNGRMLQAGYQTVIAQNPDGLLYILTYETEKLESFKNYLTEQEMKIVARLDQEDIELSPSR